MIKYLNDKITDAAGNEYIIGDLVSLPIYHIEQGKRLRIVSLVHKTNTPKSKEIVAVNVTDGNGYGFEVSFKNFHRYKILDVVRWYYAPNRFYSKVIGFEVIKETNKTLTLIKPDPFNNGYSKQREYKTSSDGTYYPTREEAVAHVKRILVRRIDNAANELREAKKKLREFVEAESAYPGAKTKEGKE